MHACIHTRHARHVQYPELFSELDFDPELVWCSWLLTRQASIYLFYTKQFPTP